MLEIRPVQDGDMAYVRANPFQEAVKNYPELPIPANTYTGVLDGEIVAVGGIKMFFPGVGEVWLIMTKYSRKDGIFGRMAYRALKKKLDELIEDLKLRRCEAQARADFPIAIRFIEALGFKFNCERENWFPDGTSALLYCKVVKR